MIKLRIILVFLLIYITHQVCFAKLFFPKIPLVHQHLFGVDLAQLNYYAGSNEKNFNFGINYQYRPVRFLSLNTALIYNHVNYQRSNQYQNIYDYNSKGICFKLGYDVSLGLSNDKKTRLFIGHQLGILNFKETGDIKIKNFWGDYNKYFFNKPKTSHATEIIVGVKTNIKKAHLIFQFYSMFLPSDSRVSTQDEIAYGYKSIFLPGYGFKRGGLNLILGF
jgi:hypothetical protein